MLKSTHPLPSSALCVVYHHILWGWGLVIKKNEYEYMKEKNSHVFVIAAQMKQ